MLEKLKNTFFAKKTPTPSARIKSSSALHQLLGQHKKRGDSFARHEISHWKEARNAFYDPTRPSSYAIQQLYADVLLDAHLSALIQTRVLRILHQNFVFKNQEGHVDKNCSAFLSKPWFRTLVGYAVESIFYGYSLIWLSSVRRGAIDTVQMIHRGHVVPARHCIVKDPLNPEKKGLHWKNYPHELLYVSFSSTPAGLLEKAAPMTILKRHSWAHWDEFEQLFGVPFRIAKVNSMQGEQADMMEQVLKQMGSAAYAIIPPTTEIDIKEHGRGDAHKVFEQKIRIIDAQLSKLILGQTMTTDSGASFSQSKIHAQTENYVIQADTIKLLSWLNDSLLPAMKSFGYDIPQNAYIDIIKDFQPAERIEIDSKLLKAGIKLSKEYIESTYGVHIENTPPSSAK